MRPSPALVAAMRSSAMPVVVNVTYGNLHLVRKAIRRQLDEIVNAANSGQDATRVKQRVMRLADRLEDYLLDNLLPEVPE